MTVSLDTFALTTVAYSPVTPMKIAHPLNHAEIILAQTHVLQIHVDRMLSVLFRITELNAPVSMEWYQVQQRKLVVFVLLDHHVVKIVNVLMDGHACKRFAVKFVHQMPIVSQMNVVIVDHVSHFVAAMMIAVMVNCVKTSFVHLDAVQIYIVHLIWLALANDVLIHVPIQPHAEQMQIVLYIIMHALVFVPIIWSVIRIFHVNIRPQVVQQQTTAHPITLVMEICVNKLVIMTIIAYPMKNAFVEHAKQFVILMNLAALDKFVQIVYVKLDAEMI